MGDTKLYDLNKNLIDKKITIHINKLFLWSIVVALTFLGTLL